MFFNYVVLLPSGAGVRPNPDQEITIHMLCISVYIHMRI